MTAAERPLLLECQNETMVSLLGHPGSSAERSDVGVLIIVGGPQYRVGSHRQFVQLARAVNQAGHTSLRFDARGMGDSTGAMPHFESMEADISCAIAGLLHEAPWVRRVVLMGLCDGASAALMYVQGQHADHVSGVCLLNPWVRSSSSLAQAQVKHYYAKQLLAPSTWIRLVSGKLSLGSVGDFTRTTVKAMLGHVGNKLPANGNEARDKTGDFRSRMLDGMAKFRGETLLVLCSEDLTAREFESCVSSSPAWQVATGRLNICQAAIEGGDHTLSNQDKRIKFEGLLMDWIRDRILKVGALQ